jgi:hypothetical protein
MKASHFATFLLIIIGGAAQHVGGMVRRRFQRRRPGDVE